MIQFCFWLRSSVVIESAWQWQHIPHMKALLSFSLTPQRDTFLKVLMPYFNKCFSKIWHSYKYHKRFLVSLLAPCFTARSLHYCSPFVRTEPRFGTVLLAKHSLDPPGFPACSPVPGWTYHVILNLASDLPRLLWSVSAPHSRQVFMTLTVLTSPGLRDTNF